MLAVVTGMGAVSPLGVGVDALWTGIAEGREAFRKVERFATGDFDAHIAGFVPGYAATKADVDLRHEYAVLAAREAMERASLHLQDASSLAARVAFVMGASVIDRDVPLDAEVARVAEALGIVGPRLGLSTACASSTNTVGVALDLLESGLADVVVAGGADHLHGALYAGFHALGALATEPCAPFSVQMGTTLGEGAGMLVIETSAHAEARGQSSLAALLGYGLSGDAYDATAPRPDGAGVGRAVTIALEHSGIEPHVVDYVNAHGTGTAANDVPEWRGVQRALGARERPLPVSSTKSIIGHTQGAAGALELITTVLAMRREVIPPTRNLEAPRRGGPDDPVARRTPRPGRIDVAVSTSSAFGGANAAVVVQAATSDAEQTREHVGPADGATPPRVRPVFITGESVVGPHGTELDALHDALDRDERIAGRLESIQIERLVRGVDPRTLDSLATLVTASAARALSDAGISVRGALRDRAGVVMGLTNIGRSSVEELDASIERYGEHNVSARAFANTVLNASAGACSRCLQLRGPHSVVAAGETSGLAAVWYAATLLSAHDDADVMVAGAAQEEGVLGSESDASAVVVLGSAPGPRSTDSAVRLAGSSLAGPNQIEDAIACALDAADVRHEDVELASIQGLEHGRPTRLLEHTTGLPAPSRTLGRIGLADAAIRMALAARAVRRGTADIALVAGQNAMLSVAHCLVRETKPGKQDAR